MIPEFGACGVRRHPGSGGVLALTLLGSMAVPGRPEEVAGIRGHVRELLGDDHPAIRDVELLTSEAVTNAITHTASGDDGGTVTVWILTGDRRVRIEVVDGGGAVLAPRPYGDLWAEHGRGLWLVAAIAVRYGYWCDGAEGIYWFEVAWGTTPPTA
jgi:anti-sigma regulatory factor (Ser/Thr protein kinase)